MLIKGDVTQDSSRSKVLEYGHYSLQLCTRNKNRSLGTPRCQNQNSLMGRQSTK